MGAFTGYKAKELEDKLNLKLKIDFKGSYDLTGWYYLDNKKCLRVSIPKGHSKEIKPGYARKIANYLKLNDVDLKRLYRCPISGQEFEAKIRLLIAQNKLPLP